MNKQKQYLRMNQLKRSIKYNSLSGNKENMFQYCKNNSADHEDAKFKVFKELINRGYSVFTEVEFVSGGRADVVCFDERGDGYIFEIINSESEDSIKNKINNYPIDFELFFVKTTEKLEIVI